MDWNRVEGNWKQVAGKVKEKWGKLTDDDLTAINGRRDQLEGKIQELSFRTERIDVCPTAARCQGDPIWHARVQSARLVGGLSAGAIDGVDRVMWLLRVKSRSRRSNHRSEMIAEGEANLR